MLIQRPATSDTTEWAVCFISNFRRNKVDSDEYFSRLVIYIHNNPVHHGFVEYPAEWQHSSWHAYMRATGTKIQKDEALHWFGGKERFKMLQMDINPNELESMIK